MQCIKPLPVMPAPCVRAPVQVPVAVLLFQLPANVRGKAAKNGPNAWMPTTNVGDSFKINISYRKVA